MTTDDPLTSILTYVAGGAGSGTVVALLLKAWLNQTFQNWEHKFTAMTQLLDERQKRVDRGLETLDNTALELIQRTSKLEREQGGLAATFATKADLEKSEQRLQREIDRNDNR